MAPAVMHPCKRCKKVLSSKTYCAACQIEIDRHQLAKAYKRSIDTDHGKTYNGRWHKASKLYRIDHPLCAMCQADGRVTPAQCVDHIIPHKGDGVLFWDQTNWQSLCYHHHNIKTATEDGGWGNIRRR